MERQPSFEKEPEYTIEELKADAIYGYKLLLEDVSVAERNGDFTKAWEAEREAHALQALYKFDFGEEMPDVDEIEGQGRLF